MVVGVQGLNNARAVLAGSLYFSVMKLSRVIMIMKMLSRTFYHGFSELLEFLELLTCSIMDRVEKINKPYSMWVRKYISK